MTINNGPRYSQAGLAALTARIGFQQQPPPPPVRPSRDVPGSVTMQYAVATIGDAQDAVASGDYRAALVAIRSARARLDNAEATIEAAAPAVADELDTAPPEPEPKPEVLTAPGEGMLL